MLVLPLLVLVFQVRQEPPGSPYAYAVNLSLAPLAQQQQQQQLQQQGEDAAAAAGGGGSSSVDAGAAAAAAAAVDTASMVGRGPVSTVYILKDPAGMLRVQVPAPKTPGPPTVMFKAAEGEFRGLSEWRECGAQASCPLCGIPTGALVAQAWLKRV